MRLKTLIGPDHRAVWEAFVDALCRSAHRCAATYDGEDWSYYADSVEACRVARAGTALVDRMEMYMEKGTVVFREDRVAGCLDWHETVSCDARWDFDDDERCDFYDGTIPTGGECEWSTECESELCSTWVCT